MARGGSRPGSGRRRKSLELHALHGTKPSYAATNLAGMPAADWRPSADDWRHLGPQSKMLLEAVLRLYTLDESEGRQALLALRSLSHVEAMEAEVANQWTHERITIDGSGQEHRERKAHALLPAIARERRLFLSAWTTLRLDRA